MSGSSGGGTTTTRTEPPDYVKPYATDYLTQAGNVANLPYTPYTGARIADFTPDQNLGFGMTQANAIGSFQAGQDANRTLADTINGKYLTADSNPYLKGAVDQALQGVQGKVNSQFAGQNYGGSAHEQLLAQQLADTSLPIYAQNYQNERNNQLAASQYAPGLSNTNIANLNASGLQQQTMNQNLNDLAYNEYQQALNYPYQQLNVLQGALGTSSGYGNTTGPNPNQTNRTASALGGAAAGAGIGSTFGPYGTAIGGGIGLLAGGFG